MRLAELALAENGAMLSCLSVPTFVRAIGAGPPVIVLHGGPGFSHDYLVAPLRSLTGRRTLVFYDQPGCGRSGGSAPDLTLELVAEHLRALVGELIEPGRPFGILANSWGVLVGLAADLPVSTGVSLNEGLFVTPVAPTRAGWDEGLGQLLARMPPDVPGAFLSDLASQTDTPCNALLPFYCAKPVPASSALLEVRGATYLRLVDQLGDYDLRPQARRVLPAVDLLFGQFDFTGSATWDGVSAEARRSATLETGHFPFWEDPAGFERVLARAFA